MILDAAALSFRNLFAPETRSVFWKVLGLTLVVLAALWFALREAFVFYLWPWFASFFPAMPDWAGWMVFVMGLFASVGLALVLALLLAPVTAIIAGLFLDDVAEVVERRDYRSDPAGTAMPIGEALVQSLQFFGIVIVGNLIALMLLFVPGINIAAFFLVNGYLLGREFFEFAAMRFRSRREAMDFRRKHSGTVFLAGLVIAGFLAIPILNLLTPLFAAGFMVHIHKKLSQKDPLFSADELRR
ncbi:sulfate transporter family protein [Rhizobium oryziradicis]|uniref:Cysteine biosynthesis protein CysZ n=1 Tax=Rhizobium oryziradicis TaxID=1867956 RepID=A0A1Q8ZX78_9HYPH|nr:sulfate transporter family protein [Rhizobium oryziradicis]OLP46656.1 cysteine biosynthesis protein CysZ [Rhizobium oryziradicis]